MKNNKNSYLSEYHLDSVTSTNKINPSLPEVIVSAIAHHLFPNYFAQYKFLKSAACLNVRAGYKLEAQKTECDNSVVGVEEVYATSLLLGIKVKTHFCIKEGNFTYIFTDDFSRSLHMIDKEEGGLIYEYRGSKDPGVKQILFPNKFLNNNCGEWLGLGCNITKLKNAYNHILDAIPEMDIQNMMTYSVSSAKEIIHNNNNNHLCSTHQDVDQFFNHLSSNNWEKISDNYLALLGLSESENL